MNNVDADVSRWYDKTENMKFLTIIEGSVWTSESFIKSMKVSYDLGETYVTETNDILFGAYFFLANTKV